MANNPSGIFIVISQMSVAFAGFGSLASRLGQGSGGDDASVDATRLRLMLFSSLSATLLGLLPSTLSGLLPNDRLAVQFSAVAASAAIIAYAATGARRAITLRRTAGFSRTGVLSNLASIVIALLSFILCAANFPSGRGEALYLLGLMGLLASSTIMFSRVIVSMLRPHHAGKDAIP